MLTAIKSAIARGPFVLGDRFSMADVILGGMLRYMVMFKMTETRPAFDEYIARISSRPAMIGTGRSAMSSD